MLGFFPKTHSPSDWNGNKIYLTASNTMVLRSIATRFAGPAMVAGLMMTLPGCGGSGSSTQQVIQEPTVVPTPVDSLRTSLTALAASGEKDSGTELLKGEIEKLRETPGADVDGLLKDFEELNASADKAKTIATAKAMLEKLPK